MQVEYLKIPKERIAVLIGPNGKTKAEIEKLTKTKIGVSSKDGEVEIKCSKPGIETILRAQDIIKAIGRGFSPENAKTLMDDDYFLEIIDLTDMFGKKEKILEHKRGRIIGRGGKIRDTIEDLTGAKISVYGKTISIIGSSASLQSAREAINMMLEGSMPKKVYDYLKRNLARDEFEI